MKFPVAAALLVLTLAAGPAARAHDDEAEATPTPSIYTRALQFVHLKHRDPAASGQQSTVELHRQLELKIDVSPMPVKLSDTRQIKVDVSLFNRSHKYAHLDFPTTQRIEVLLKNSAGKVVTQWSEDQSFTNDPSSVTINPGERLQYTASVSTREMAAGQAYIVEASFPNFAELKIQQPVTAEP